MSKNCLTCRFPIPVGDQPNENGGRFHECTAPIVVPAFGMHYRLSQVQRWVNLAHFEPGHVCYERQSVIDCPLYEETGDE